jgi:hypothetical protein
MVAKPVDPTPERNEPTSIPECPKLVLDDAYGVGQLARNDAATPRSDFGHEPLIVTYMSNYAISPTITQNHHELGVAVVSISRQLHPVRVWVCVSVGGQGRVTLQLVKRAVAEP